MRFVGVPLVAVVTVALGREPGADAPRQARNYSSLEDIAAFVNGYSADPCPDDVLTAIRWLFEHRAFDDASGFYWPFAGFVSGCFVTDPSLGARAWKSSRDRDDLYEQTFVLSAVWLAGAPWGQDIIKEAKTESDEPRMIRLATHYLDEPSVFFNSTGPVSQSVEVDMLWGRFQATSDTGLVERVVLTAASDDAPPCRRRQVVPAIHDRAG